MRIKQRTRFSAPLLAIAAGLMAQQTQAQNEEPAERVMEEVVVSALKGATGTALSDTALAITAVDGGYLEDLAATGIADIIERAPGASMFPTSSPRSQTIQIRGISASRGDALVGYYIDDFAYVSLLGVSTPEIVPFDLQRVEVLKGPQGTLYGAGSTGGTIRVLSNKADTVGGFSGRIELGAHTISGGSDGTTLAGVVNIPIIPEKLALRATAHVRDRAGWLDYENGPDDFNELDGENYKLQLGFTPTDRLRIDAGYHKYEIESTPIYSDPNLDFTFPAGEDHPATELIAGLSAGIFGAAFGPDSVPQLTEIFTQSVGSLMLESPGALFDSEGGAAGTLPYDEGEYELFTSALTYEFDALQFYMTANRMEESSGGLAQISLARDGYSQSELETTNIEIRLASKNEGKLNWTAGYYYLDHEESNSLGAAIFPVFDSTQSGGDLDLGGGVFFPVPGVSELTSVVLTHTAIQSEQQAIFGEVHYQFNDKYELTAGLRYYEDEREAEELLPVYGPILEDLNVDNPWSETFDGVTGRVNLKVNWNEDVMSYFSVSTAQRAGTPNLGVTQAAEFLSRPEGYKPPPFTDEENLTAFEIGTKWFASETLYIDAAVYYNDWEDIILELSEFYIDAQFGAPSSGFVRENAGDAESYGLEASLNWAPTDSISVSGGLNLMESEYVNTPDNAGVSDGDAIQSVPDWTGFASIDYVRPVSLFAGSEIVAGLFGSYTGERYAYGSGGEKAKTDGFGRMDARAGLQTEAWSVVLHVKNLTDSDDMTFNTTGGLAIEPYDAYMQPRTTELVFRYAF
jgi:iron complex outermembrane recepter protein